MAGKRKFGELILKREIRRNMKKIIEMALEWLSMSPLRGYRTQAIWVIAVGAFIAKGHGLIDQATYDAIQGVVVPTGLLTAAYKKT